MMKFLFLSAFLFVGLTTASSQTTTDPSSNVQYFEPLNIKGQKRPVEVPKPGPPKNPVYWGVWIGLMIGIFFLARMLFFNFGATGRIITVVLALLLALGVSFIVVMVRAFDFDTGPPNLENIAAVDFYKMTEEMGSETPYHQVISDEDYRVGVGLGAKRLVIADYKTNKGITVAIEHVDTLLAYEGAADTLPALPLNDEYHWVIETADAQQAGGAVLQQVEYLFNDAKPRRVIVRFAKTGYPFPDAHAMQEMFNSTLQYYRENPQE